MPVTNWARNLEFTPTAEVSPTSVAEVVSTVLQATRARQSVRAVGTVWSFTDVTHTSGVLITTDRLNRIHGFAQGRNIWPSATGPTPTSSVFGGLLPEVASSGRRFVHIEAGVTVRSLYEALDSPSPSGSGLPARSRWGLITQGGSGGQTLVGAIATGTHGADHGYPPLAGMVRALHMVGPGGRQHWIERTRGFERITEHSGPRAWLESLAAGEFEVHYDDELFRGALVGLGALGVIVAVVVEAVEQYGLSQRLIPMRWSAVKEAWRSDRLFTVEDRANPHPTSVGSRRVNASPTGLEIFLNPYRVDDSYSDRTSSSDRECLLVHRAQAIALDNAPGAFSGHFSYPALNIDTLGLITDIDLHGPDRYRARVNEVMLGGRAETVGYPVAYSVRDTYNYHSRSVWAMAAEAVVGAGDDTWIRFIDWWLAQFDLLVSRGQKFAGFASLRFSRAHDGLLSMQNLELGNRPRSKVCHIELSCLQEFNATHVPSDPTNLEGSSDAFVASFEDSVVAVDGRMHWGQLHRLDRAAVEDAYRLTLPSWKSVRTTLSARGRWDTFSNQFTRRCGLESNQETIAAASWGRGRYDLFTYDEVSNLLHSYWDGQWHWGDRLRNRLYPAQRFIGPLTATSWGHGRVDVFGMGQNNELLHVSWAEGAWHWTNLGRPFPHGEHFLGPIAACASERGRVDIFGLGPTGNVLRVYFDGAWRGESLGNDFDHNQRFSGSLTAAAWSPGRFDIFGLGRGKQLLQLWRHGDGWRWSEPQIPFPRGQHFVAPPAVTSWGPGRLDLLGLGPNNNVLHAWWHGQWAGEDLGNEFRTTTVALARHEGPDAHYRMSPREQATMFVGPIGAASMQAGRLDYFGMDSQGRLLQVWYGGDWVFSEHTEGWRGRGPIR